jgi:predicted amidohydrolase
MMICNDRRWPESYREMGLQGVEMILCGYNTPIHYVPDPTQDILQGFHNSLVMQSGAYQNGTWVIGVAKAGVEEGVDSLGQSCIVAPSGQIVSIGAGVTNKRFSISTSTAVRRSTKESLPSAV